MAVSAVPVSGVTASGRWTGHRGPQRPRAVSARRVAFDVLRAVQVDDAYANLLLPTRIRRAGLAARDAAFATELTYGTIRMLGRYDAVIALASGRRLDNIESDVLDVLRLGTHQLLGMRTATHAAVSATVELAREVGATRATGFVNAVLRKVAARTDDEWDAPITAGRGGDALLATRWSHPDVGRVRAPRRPRRGASRDELAALLAADNVAPRVQLVALPGRATADDVQAATDADDRRARTTRRGPATSRQPTLRRPRDAVAPATASDADDPGAALEATDDGAAAGTDSSSVPPVRTAVAEADARPVSPVGVRGIAGDPARVPGVAAGGCGCRTRDRSRGPRAESLVRVRAGERWLDMCAGPAARRRSWPPRPSRAARPSSRTSSCRRAPDWCGRPSPGTSRP